MFREYSIDVSVQLFESNAIIFETSRFVFAQSPTLVRGQANQILMVLKNPNTPLVREFLTLKISI
ncbi:MAG: hypothetical protein AABW75_02775 [Nanoarchaeota archaeon]